MIYNILKYLRKGSYIQLNDYKTLSFDKNTGWVIVEQVCISDTCACNSHDRYSIYNITRKTALEEIKKYIQKQEDKKQILNKDIEMLDKWINEEKTSMNKICKFTFKYEGNSELILVIKYMTDEQIENVFNNYNKEYNDDKFNGSFLDYLNECGIKYSIFDFDIKLEG